MQTTPVLRLSFVLMTVGLMGMGWALLARSSGAGLSTMLMALGPLGGALSLRAVSMTAARLLWLFSCLAGFSAAAFYGMDHQWVNAGAFVLIAAGFGIVSLFLPQPSTTRVDAPAERRA